MADLCCWCGEPYEVDVLEVWGRDFVLATCCEAVNEEIIFELNGGGECEAECRRWLRSLLLAAGIETRQVYHDHARGNIRIDNGLRLATVDLRTAKDFVAKHHRHNRPPPGWRWGHAVWNGPDLIGVASTAAERAG